MVDPRVEKLAKILIDYSCDVQKGEKVLISYNGTSAKPLVKELIKEIYRVGGLPYVEATETDITRELIKGCTSEQLAFMKEYQMAQINRGLLPELDTLLLPARAEHLHISSTMVRDMIRYHQTLDQCMPAPAAAVLQRIREGKVK